MVHLNIDWS